MAKKFDLDLDPENDNIETKNNIEGFSEEDSNNTESNYENSYFTEEETEEAENPYQIEIANKEIPIVVFFGPFASGKTMTLVRLARFLHDNGYKVSPNRDFRPGKEYEEICETFENSLSTQTALKGTDLRGFLLAKVIKDQRVICQLLEAPGEHYFDPKNIKTNSFPPYMKQMFQSIPNRKIWIFLTEEVREPNAILVNPKTRNAYIKRVQNSINELSDKKDRFIILYNKVDANPELFNSGELQFEEAQQRMIDKYPGLAETFINHNPISRLWRRYNFHFVPFSTGTYTPHKSDVIYTQSNDRYPRYLWNRILKSIKG